MKPYSSCLRELECGICRILRALLIMLRQKSPGKRIAPDSVIVMISGQQTIECAIDAMRAGAFDYITKPFELSQVRAVVGRALAHRERFANVARETHMRAMAERHLQQAVEADRFIVHYQPQVEIQSRRIVGAEALVR